TVVTIARLSAEAAEAAQRSRDNCAQFPLSVLRATYAPSALNLVSVLLPRQAVHRAEAGALLAEIRGGAVKGPARVGHEAGRNGAVDATALPAEGMEHVDRAAGEFENHAEAVRAADLGRPEDVAARVHQHRTEGLLPVRAAGH